MEEVLLSAGFAAAHAGNHTFVVTSVAPHEHLPQLVEVVFDDVGHSLREFTCTACQAGWFE